MLFKEKIAVHCENHTEQASTPSGQIAELKHSGAGCTYNSRRVLCYLQAAKTMGHDRLLVKDA
jgi:hypothetical protein